METIFQKSFKKHIKYETLQPLSLKQKKDSTYIITDNIQYYI